MTTRKEVVRVNSVFEDLRMVDLKPFKKGSHTYLDEAIGNIIYRHHLRVDKKIFATLSKKQLKGIIKRCEEELEGRKK